MKEKLVSFAQLLCVALLGLSYFGSSIVDPDLGWHLLGGEYVFKTGRVPRMDLINIVRERWHDYHWLYQYLLFRLYRAFSYEGLTIFFGFFSALFFVAILSRLRRVLSLQLAFLAFFIFYLVLQPAWVMRPQAVSLMVLFAVQVVLERRLRYELPLLFILSVLLVNMHVYWVFIPLLWFLYRVLPRLFDERVSPLYGWGGAFLLSSAGLVSPYGLFGSDSSRYLENYSVLWDYLLLQPTVRGRIAEMASPFMLGGYIGVLLLFLLVVSARQITGELARKEIGRVSFFVLTFLLALLSSKYLGVFAVSLVFLLPTFLAPVESHLSKFALREGTLALLLLVGMYSAWTVYFTFPNKFELRDKLQSAFPLKECSYIAGEPGSSHRVLTHFNTGGWCAFAGHETTKDYRLKVLVDNRTQGVPDEYYRKAFSLYDLKEDWLTVLLDWRYDYLVIEKRRPLAQLLSRDRQGWELVKEGDAYAVFRRAGGKKKPGT